MAELVYLVLYMALIAGFFVAGVAGTLMFMGAL